jgi:hypothetical protein
VVAAALHVCRIDGPDLPDEVDMLGAGKPVGSLHFGAGGLSGFTIDMDELGGQIAGVWVTAEHQLGRLVTNPMISTAV